MMNRLACGSGEQRADPADSAIRRARVAAAGSPESGSTSSHGFGMASVAATVAA